MPDDVKLEEWINTLEECRANLPKTATVEQHAKLTEMIDYFFLALNHGKEKF
jgi:hypothetical protein